MDFYGHFAPAALRLDHAGETDKVKVVRFRTHGRRLLNDFELVTLAGTITGGVEQRAQGASGASLASDHCANVALGDLELNYAIVEKFDENFLRHVDQRFRYALNQRANIR